MRTLACAAALTLGLFCNGVCGAERTAVYGAANAPPPSRVAEAPLQAGKCLSIDITLVDAASAVGNSPSEMSADRLLEMEKQGKVEASTHVRLTTLENCQAYVQFGENVPMVSGTSTSGRPGGPVLNNYQMIQVGTLVRVTPRVEETGDVVLALDVERSRVAKPPEPPRENPMAAPTVPPPASVVSLTVNTAIRLPAGKMVIVEGREKFFQETRQTWIVASAHVLDSKRSRIAARDFRCSCARLGS